MKFSRILAAAMLLCSLTCVGFSVQADDSHKALIYISPHQYTHDTLLRHHYINYWFSQGAFLEPVALETLQPVLGEVAMCRDNLAADVVVMLTPRMFYNPVPSTYYGKITAHVVSGSGKPLANYKAKVEHVGFLDVEPEQQIKATYRAAMSDIVRQMQADASVQKLLTQGLPENETRMPCGMVGIIKPGLRAKD